MPPTARTIRHVTIAGRQVTWHVIVRMIPSATCAMYLGMLLDSVPKPMFLESGEEVEAAEVAAVAIEMLCVGTASSSVI